MKKEKLFTVYLHRSPSNKYYVGITSSSLIKRWHLDGSGYKSQKKFWNAIKKYGWDNFEHIIVAIGLSEDEACKLEQQLIIKYNSKLMGYNSDDGGKGSLGHSVSDDAKALMSRLKKGKSWTDSQKQARALTQKRMTIKVYDLDGKLLFNFYGYKEASNKLNIGVSTLINCCNYGFICAEKYFITNDKNDSYIDSIINKHKELKNKPTIACYDLNGNLLNTFITYKQASESTGIPVGSIGKVCGGLELKIKNYIFLKINEETIEDRLLKIKNYTGRDYSVKDYIVEQYDLNLNLLATYTSYQEAAARTNINKKLIIVNCIGKSKTCKGYIFKKKIKEESK